MLEEEEAVQEVENLEQKVQEEQVEVENGRDCGTASVAGTVNTGGGGGGGSGPSDVGSAGGSGIIIIRAPGSANLGAAPGANTVTTLPAPAGGCKVATFTVSGTLTT
jgi:hypothetical protein